MSNNSLLKTTTLIGIGTFTAKILRFILLPIFAAYLSKKELGLYDLVMSSLLLAESILTLKISDSIYRYSINSKYNSDEVIWNGILILSICMFIGLLILIPILIYYKFALSIEFVSLVIAKIMFNLFSEITRSKRKILLFSIGNILVTLFILLSCTISVIVFKKGLRTILELSAVSYFIVAIYYMYASEFYNHKIKIKLQYWKIFLVYSLPLLPSAINWWLMRLSNRYIVTNELGISFNAILAISMTLPSVMVMMGQIFYFAWQDDSFTNFNSSYRNDYFSKVYNNYISFQFLIATFGFLFSEFIYYLIYPSTYNVSWKMSFFFFLGSIFNNLSSFLSIGYTGSFKTKGAFISSIYGSAVCVLSTFFLVKYINMWGAPIGFLIGFFTLWVYRTYDTKKFFLVKFNRKLLLSNVAIYMVSVIYVFLGTISEKLYFIISICFLSICVNKFIIVECIKKVLFYGRKVFNTP